MNHPRKTSPTHNFVPLSDGSLADDSPGRLFLVPPDAPSGLPSENPDSDYYRRLCATLDAVFGLDQN